MRRLKALLALGAFLGLSAQLWAQIPAQVEIDTGQIRGTTGQSPNVHVFKGIPFAAPPLGANRWRPPQPVEPWSGTRSAEQFSARCMQGNFGGGTAADADEDCLYLNVWTTAESAGAREPVMVWIYGGGLWSGSGSEPRYHGENLSKKGAVVVTLDYRLGAFGFLAHPELSAESGRDASGNYGMMDVVAVLRWVQRNIDQFGGDPRNVTVFGESAGAIMAAALVGSPEAEGLFHRIIAQSGAWMGLGMARMSALARAEEVGARSLEEFGAASIAELRAKPADDILTGVRGGSLVVDGYLIPEDLSNTFDDGRQHSVDVLAGSNRDEGTLFSFGGNQTVRSFTRRSQQRFGPLADQFARHYPAGSDEQAHESYLASFSDEAAWHQRLLASRQASLGNSAYVYYFTRVPPAVPGRPSLGATHVAEIEYMFNNLGRGRSWTDTDRELAETMSSYWVNFARSGDPNGPGLPSWPRYRDYDSGNVMILGDKVMVESETVPPAGRLKFFDAAYARLLAQ